MATDEGVTLPVGGENGSRSIQLPEGWIESAAVRARRVGESVVLEPVVFPAPMARHGDVHAAWSPGYWEWLDAARERGDFGVRDIESRGLRSRTGPAPNAPPVIA